MSGPPVTHDPHTYFLVFRHDCGVKYVWQAGCPEGRCLLEVTSSRIPRYAAVNIEVQNLPGYYNFHWTHEDEVLFHMASLKLALHEGRQKTVDTARAHLLRLQRKAFK